MFENNLQPLLYCMSSEQVKKHACCRWNLRLFNGLSPHVADALDDDIETEQALVEDDRDQEGQLSADLDEGTPLTADQGVIEVIYTHNIAGS